MMKENLFEHLGANIIKPVIRFQVNSSHLVYSASHVCMTKLIYDNYVATRPINTVRNKRSEIISIWDWECQLNIISESLVSIACQYPTPVASVGFLEA